MFNYKHQNRENKWIYGTKMFLWTIIWYVLVHGYVLLLLIFFFSFFVFLSVRLFDYSLILCLPQPIFFFAFDI